MVNLKNQKSKAFKTKIIKTLKHKNIMQAPLITNIVVSTSTKDATTSKTVIGDLQKQLAIITGQKPIVTKARKSIAGFKLREETPIGCKVTLRGAIMTSFFDKLVTIIFPRIRDFRGFSKKSFDGQGNFNLGIKEQLVFPEIDYDKIKKLYGMNITINTSAKSNHEGYVLLKELGFPLKD